MPDFMDPWVAVGSIGKAIFYYQIIFFQKFPQKLNFIALAP